MLPPLPAGPVLITGFEPFDGAATNPSGEVALALDGRMIAGRPVVGVVLPCVFGEAAERLEALLAEYRPAIVLALVLAAGRAGVTPERVAINVDDARIADNAGRRRTDTPVVAGGPVAYWSTLPAKAIVAALAEAGIPGSVSSTAGTFVCNHVFYALVHALRDTPGIRAGFIHLPCDIADAPAGTLALPFATLVRAVEIAASTALSAEGEARVAGGSVH